tara:strand:+ start:44 stop:274 length:231 start_codon:yes stop_codon:yes gene_type:complete
MTELKNYIQLEHIATSYPVTIALNSKECQLFASSDTKCYDLACQSVENRMQLNGDIQENESLLENYFIENIRIENE